LHTCNATRIFGLLVALNIVKIQGPVLRGVGNGNGKYFGGIAASPVGSYKAYRIIAGIGKNVIEVDTGGGNGFCTAVKTHQPLVRSAVLQKYW